MRLSDAIKAKRAAKLDDMEALSKSAEGRLFTAAEDATWKKLQGEVAEIDAQLASQEQREAIGRGAPGRALAPGSGPRLVADDGTVVRALTLADRLVETVPHRTMGPDDQPPSIARALRGVVLGDWSRATRIERAMGEGVLAQLAQNRHPTSTESMG